MSTQQMIPILPHNGSATSRAAAASAAKRAPADEARILDVLAATPWGLTCDEIEVALELSHQTASARLRGLSESGRVFHHGTRATRSGRAARVYFHRSAP